MKKSLFILFVLCCFFGFAQETTWEGLDISNYPLIEGHFGHAERYSGRKSKLVIYISGGQGVDGQSEPYTAREYAEILYEGFKNPNYTNYPTDIVVFYDEKLEKRVTKASVIICGEQYKTKSGNFTFSPVAIGNNIDVFTKRFYQKTGLLEKAKNK